MFNQSINQRIFSILFLGFSSGLPLALTGSTLQAWFTQSGVNILTIGALSLLGIPYFWKFLWAPLLDRFVPPLWGRRRGWILIAQLGLCISLFVLAHCQPLTQASLIGFIALLIAFLSASQDIAVDAYRTDILQPEERGLGAATYTFAYRMAMLVSGGLALVLADYLGWQLTYEVFAVLMGITTIATYFAPNVSGNDQPPQTFFSAVVDPFFDLFKREKILLILLFILLYKVGDALALALMSNFLLSQLGFTLTEVGLAYKTVGLFSTIVGAFVGGIFLTRLNILRALFWFGVLQAFSNLMFMFLAIVGKNYSLAASTISIEAFCSGMSTAAFVAFLMSLCHSRYSATQFALLSALASAGRIFSGPIAALMVKHIGWVNFFGWTFILSLPGILLLTTLRSRVSINHVEATT